MSKAHTLSAFEESFLEDGIVAVCACGWKSKLHISEGNAIEEHAKHSEQATMIVCGACGCPRDEDGCGCNPEGA